MTHTGQSEAERAFAPDGDNAESKQRYTKVAMVLHWLTAAAFAFQIGLGWRMAAPPGPETFAVFQLHKSIGIAILLLSIARLAWRLGNPPPPMPGTVRPIEKIAAHCVHVVFYLLLMGLPLSGWLIVSSSKVSVPTHLFGLVPWPHIPVIAGLSASMREAVNAAAENTHAVMVWIALLAIALHIVGALKHQLFEGGTYLARMMDAPRRVLGAAAIAAAVAVGGLMLLGRSIHLTPIALVPPPVPTVPPAPMKDHASTPVAAPDTSIAPANMTDDEGANVTEQVALSPIWAVRMRDSSIRFHTSWSQGPVDGSFARWRAKIRFDPDALATASADITIDMASIAAADSDQQSALPEGDWFAVAAHPSATWHATGFRHLQGKRYAADGILTLRGLARPVPLTFTLSVKDDVATMAGSATVDRTAFGVGQGEWASTADLPAAVGVSIVIKADRSSQAPKKE